MSKINIIQIFEESPNILLTEVEKILSDGDVDVRIKSYFKNNNNLAAVQKEIELKSKELVITKDESEVHRLTRSIDDLTKIDKLSKVNLLFIASNVSKSFDSDERSKLLATLNSEEIYRLNDLLSEEDLLLEQFHLFQEVLIQKVKGYEFNIL